MTTTKRGTHERSLANLALGRKKRGAGKVRMCFTVKPETRSFLAYGGSASQRLDELVSKVQNGELINSQHLLNAMMTIENLRTQLETLRRDRDKE